jgi:hypothetical protein
MAERTLTGSCLCGAVHYTVTGEAQRFFHCHCSRCRKATGTGHSSNLFVKGSLKWDSGEDLVRSFKLPQAARFTNAFCSTCGARLPRFIPQLETVFIPAGSLDVEPDIGPQGRIFQGSRAGWSCDGSTLPGYEEYAS